MNFEPEYIKKLAKILSDGDLSEITLESGEEALVLKRERNVVAAAPAVMQIPAAQPVQAVQTQADTGAPSSEPAAEKAEDKGQAILSPMVGTFYAAPGADEAPFVKVGQSISKGQVVCIIEAMKLMNKIESEFAGTITEICVENGKSVEYGQPLMYVK